MNIEIKSKKLKILGHDYDLLVTNAPILDRGTIATTSVNTLTIEISNIFPLSRHQGYVNVLSISDQVFGASQTSQVREIYHFRYFLLCYCKYE